MHSIASTVLTLQQARKRVPYLRRFENDWATSTYLHRTFSNRRGYLHSRKTDAEGAGPSGACNSDDNGSCSDSDDGLDDDIDNIDKEDDADEFMNDSDDDNC